MEERSRTTDKTFLSLISSQQEDLKRIGDILNDKIAQDLYAIRVSLQSYVVKNGRDEIIDGVKKSLTDCIANVRYIADYLYPSLLKDYGLKRALEELIKEFRKKNNVVSLNVDPRISDITNSNQLYLYRLFQLYFEEAQLNYSSRSLDIIIKLHYNKIKVIIEDDIFSSNESHWLQMETNKNVQKIKNLVLLNDGIFEFKTNKNCNSLILTFIDHRDD